MRVQETTVWARLQDHQCEMATCSMREVFAQDSQRFETFSSICGDLLFDFSKHLLTTPILQDLCALAQVANLPQKREALFGGGQINVSERRAAAHMLLRRFDKEPFWVEGIDVRSEIMHLRERIFAFSHAIREGAICGATGEPFTDIVNIGIGGSDLGPAMATRALAPFGHPRLRCHFVSNVDGADIGDCLKGLSPARTLFIISSKTFTTLETMTNARSARAFIEQSLGEAAFQEHAVAISTYPARAEAFGIKPDRIFGFWEWVGGRYSIWSAIGLPLLLSIGQQAFEDFLKGGAEVDHHFLHAPFAKNIPVLMGILGVWYRNFWNFAGHAVIPYDQRLCRFPAYLQQLEMESNGKSVNVDGEKLDMATTPILWGEPGTNSQHAFFQWLHQSTDRCPVDFLVAAHPMQADVHHHALLFANCLAQSAALLWGRADADTSNPYKIFRGHRPSSTFLYPQLTPYILGQLIALYEHKTFVQSVIWNINPFDQWGVELGKELATQLAPLVEDATLPLTDIDISSAGLILYRRRTN